MIHILFFLISTQLVYAQLEPKIVGLVPVRNEEAIIGQCLRALALYTDAIVVLDDASDDKTVEVVESLTKECNIERIIVKQKWFRDEPGDKNKLIKAGRAINGTHFIVIDADEMLTSNFLNNNLLKETILSLKQGDSIELNWIALWRSVNFYRFDNSVWTNNYGCFIFCDDGIAEYSSNFIHCGRVPKNLKGNIYRISGYKYGLMHFQFVNWNNLLIKHVWYRFMERIRLPQKPIYDINALYGMAIDEQNLRRKFSPKVWFEHYPFFDPEVYNAPDNWRKNKILEWIQEYGFEFFNGLDIAGLSI